ncbi:MAG: CPBP family intramembrane glutamic endopeptidase [Solirubrobacteraceae bacterium]
MGSAIFELVLLSLPSLVYVRRLRRAGVPRRPALSRVGLQPAGLGDYTRALALLIPVTALGTILLQLIPTSLLNGSSKNISGVPSTAGGYAAIVILALAEEMFFRGLVAGLLIKRFGFRKGNALQAMVFLAPHLLLLLVSLRLWPLLPLQLVAGWTLGWLRERSQSIGPPWLAHAITNLLPALLFGL